jgi:sigma-B regulation protein RsbU (phosphoserine phosphatase)
MIKRLQEIYERLCEISGKESKIFDSEEKLLNAIEEEIEKINAEILTYKQELESSTILIESQLEEITRLYEEISTLFEISKIIASNIETKQILRPILYTLKKAIGFKCGIISLNFDGKVVETVGTCPENIDQLLSENAKEVSSETVIKERCEKLNGESIIFKYISTTSDEKSGYLLFVGKESGSIFTAGDKKIVESTAQQISGSIEREIALKEEIERERLNQQIEIARNIQFNFFPKKFPHDDNFDSFGESTPAIHVGGDYFDVFIKNDFLFGIVADVSGKGLPASLIMSSMRSAFKSLIESTDGDLKRTFNSLNNMVSVDVGEDRFVTCVSFKISRDGVLEVINAGHDPLYIVNSSSISKVQSTNTPLGMFEDMDFEVQTFKLSSGDLIFAYTDGIPEARNLSGEEYDFERLERILKKVYLLSAKEIIYNVENDVFRFSQGAPQHDDMTLLAIKYFN